MLRTPAAEPVLVKTCCADLWAHPGIRLLVGDSLHPGGLDLTARAVEALGLPRGARVLDVGCGPGATGGLLRRAGLRTTGIDYSAPLVAEAAGRVPDAAFAAADGERLPFADGAFDGVLAECVLSVVPDVEAAARELARVLRPGGRVALSDVAREGPLPDELETFVSWIACAAGALPADGYRELLEGAGMGEVTSEDHGGALTRMIERARRRLALLQGSMAAGLLDPGPAGLDPGMADAGQRLLEMAAAAVREGGLGYVLVTGRRTG